MFAFPGVWQRWCGPVKKDRPNGDLDVYAFMTTAPNELTRSINHERMPVLLSGDDQFETWLSGTSEQAFKLAKSFDPTAMRIVQSGRVKEDLLGLPVLTDAPAKLAPLSVVTPRSALLRSELLKLALLRSDPTAGMNENELVRMLK